MNIQDFDIDIIGVTFVVWQLIAIYGYKKVYGKDAPLPGYSLLFSFIFLSLITLGLACIDIFGGLGIVLMAVFCIPVAMTGNLLPGYDFYGDEK